MDKKAALKREVVLVEVAIACGLSLAVWLLPKVFRFQVWYEAVTGVAATASLVAAGYRVSLLEKEELMDRVVQAAQRDLFTSEMATDVYLGQLQQQQAIQAMMPTQHQDTKSETPANQVVQPSSMPSIRQVATLPSEPKVLDIAELGDYPSVIIYGPQASGKTTLTRAIVQQRLQAGHTCEALDPHGSRWPCSTVGAGMDYDAVETRLGEISTLIKERYQYCKENELDPNDVDFPPVTLICDELTNWGPRMDNAVVVNFIRECWSDIRKVDILALFVNHANTIEGGLAGAKGLADLRDQGCIQLELFTQPNPQTGKAMPAGKGRLKLPGQTPVEVIIPQLTTPPAMNKAIQTLNNLNRRDEYAEYKQGEKYRSFPQSYSDPQNIHEEPIQPPFAWLDGEKFIQIMQAIATQSPKHRSIEAILGFKAGATQNWQQASRDWDIVKQTMTQAET